MFVHVLTICLLLILAQRIQYEHQKGSNSDLPSLRLFLIAFLDLCISNSLHSTVTSQKSSHRAGSFIALLHFNHIHAIQRGFVERGLALRPEENKEHMHRRVHDRCTPDSSLLPMASMAFDAWKSRSLNPAISLSSLSPSSKSLYGPCRLFH